MCLCTCPTEKDEDCLPLPDDIKIPIKNRKQTDVSCSVIFIAIFMFLAIIVLIASIRGDVRRFTHGYDDKGNICGFKNACIKGVKGSGMDFTQEKYLSIKKYCGHLENCCTERECVKECKDGILNSSIIPQCVTDVEEGNCNSTSKISLGVVISDISFCWKEIVEVCLLTTLLSAMTMMILPMYPKLSVWIFLVLVCVAAIGFAILAWRLCIKMFLSPWMELNVLQKSMWASKTTYFLVASIVATVFSILCLFMPCCVKPKVRLIPRLFEEGSKCIRDIPVILIQPVSTLLISGGFTCFMILGVVCLFTSGKAEVDFEGKVSFPNNAFFQISTWLLLFTFFWLSQFFLACQNFITAGSASAWYFSRVNGEITNPYWSFPIIVKHHLGSIVFGSLVISIIRPLQFIYRLFKGRNATSPLANFNIWDNALSFLRIISKNAYVMIVLFGEPFCTSARKAFTCIASESSLVAFLLRTKTCMLTVVELLIAVFVTFVGETRIMNIEEIQVFWIPSCVMFITSFFCCHVFFSVYNMTIDTIILCCCVDHQMNDGLKNPYYLSKNLKVLFNKEDTSTTALTGAENDASISMDDLKKFSVGSGNEKK